jgi:hypothetical protein
MPIRRAYGYVPDKQDDRDHAYMPKLGKPRPASFDLSTVRPNQRRLDQGNLGSCVAHGTAGAVLFHQPDFLLSRLWLYYKTRALEHTIHEDAGCEIRDAIKVITKHGAPPEPDWPYDVAKFARRPPAKTTADAKKEIVVSYQRIDTAEAARDCIASGNPYIVGFDLFQGFESEQAALTGNIPMPRPGETPIGGHCMLGWAYSPTHDTTLNSWYDPSLPGSEPWGDNGLAHFPRGYVEKYASDMWAITACQQKP